MELQVRDQKASGNGLNTDTSTQALAMTTDSADPEGPWNCRAQDLTFLEDWLAEWKWAQRREFPTSHPLGALSSPSTPTPIFLLFSWDHHDTDRATRWGGGGLCITQKDGQGLTHSTLHRIQELQLVIPTCKIKIITPSPFHDTCVIFYLNI